MVEYSLGQLMGICLTIVEFCEKHGLSKDEIDLLRVRLSDPKPNGEISFDLGMPDNRFPCHNRLRQ